jgi:hypothetical protein
MNHLIFSHDYALARSDDFFEIFRYGIQGIAIYLVDHRSQNDFVLACDIARNI